MHSLCIQRYPQVTTTLYLPFSFGHHGPLLPTDLMTTSVTPAIGHTTHWSATSPVRRFICGVLYLSYCCSPVLAGSSGTTPGIDIWRKDLEPEEGFAESDHLGSVTITPSMRATAKYFWTVTILIVVQILLGILTAHYQVEGQGLYGLPLVDYLPYAVSRTWHTQLAVLWIATSWLAAGLYVSPLLSGHEPKFQRFGVNFLFLSLLLIVVGSFAGQWFAVHGFIDDGKVNFWFGHQGYEYVDLGRFWQIYLLGFCCG
jgi:hypothetical protein